jgi:DtxR family Mn-dependent transcriptional regulator
MAENTNQSKSVLFDEILEILYVRRENGKTISADAFLRIEHFGQKFTSAIIEEAIEAGLIKKVNSTLDLTNRGLFRATQLIRCYRLAERLLTDILNVQDNLVESSACRFEHILSEEVADSICTLLGHPHTCPHGRPIPQGMCCRRAQKQIAPIVRPLSRFLSGEKGMVAYISSPYHDRLTRLESMGLSPGQEIIVRQVHPSFIVSCGETELALEKSVADEIYLRVSSNNMK